MAEEVMIQDSIPICPKCKGALRKMCDNDVWYVCLDTECKTVLKVIDYGQSCRELKCEVIR